MRRWLLDPSGTLISEERDVGPVGRDHLVADPQTREPIKLYVGIGVVKLLGGEMVVVYQQPEGSEGFR